MNKRPHTIIKLIHTTLILATLCQFPTAFAAGETDAKAGRIDGLLARMTLDEKIGQTVLLTGYGVTTGPVREQTALEDHVRRGECGSVFNVLSVAQVRRLQKMAVEETRLHVPLIFGFDTIHGYKTIFPISLGETASWNMELIEKAARVAATESAAAGLDWTFAPMVDIARDPRWGRISEGAGEDPFLGSQVAAARVRGFQGTNLAAPDAVLACVKHYAAYGAPVAGREYNTVDMSERLLREVYLPPYRAAIEAGALSVMTSFNELNGTPATANRFLLKQILRDEWGFSGFVVTDYTSINEMVAHGSAADEADAGAQALQAGVDMDMQGHVYRRFLKSLVESGKVSEAQIQEAAGRVLELKSRLGLLDNPYLRCDEQRETRLLLAQSHRDTAYRMACESFVLLKNERRTLPLSTSAKIAVVGPLADSQRDLIGSWSGAGEYKDLETVLTAIRRTAPSGKITYARGCDVNSTNKSGFREALSAVRKADVAVLVLGESGDMSGEAKCRTSINLPGSQTALLRAVKQLGKPVVVVLMNGRPLALEEEAGLADAILETWFPGTEGGRAVADVLFGHGNPSGKLPVTFPRNLGQVPIYYSAKNTGRPLDPSNPLDAYKSTYLDCSNDPLFPFGHGLSYGEFNYSDLALNRTQLHKGETMEATVKITNIGRVTGKEVVQLYLRDLVGSVTRPLLELKGFQKIELKPGESRVVSFAIGEKEMQFLRADMTWGVEPGKFNVFVGGDSRNLHGAEFELLKP